MRPFHPDMRLTQGSRNETSFAALLLLAGAYITRALAGAGQVWAALAEVAALVLGHPWSCEMAKGAGCSGPLLLARSRPEPGPLQVQLVMVRLVVSQWLVEATLLSLLVKVTSHDTPVLALTVNVVLFVVRVLSAADVAFVSVFWYCCPLTAEPPPTPQVVPVNSWVESVPFSGAP